MMQITATPGQIAAIFQAVSQKAAAAPPAPIARHVAEIVRTSWADNHQIEDLLFSMGVRGLHMDGADICSVFGVPQRSISLRPRAKDRHCFGFVHTAASDVAMLVITLERCGFGIDPAPLVTALLPTIRCKTMITHAELHALWYAQEQHKSEPVMMIAPSAEPHGASFDSVTLPSGYHAETRTNEGGHIERLTVHSPKRCRRSAAS